MSLVLFCELLLVYRLQLKLEKMYIFTLVGSYFLKLSNINVAYENVISIFYDKTS